MLTQYVPSLVEPVPLLFLELFLLGGCGASSLDFAPYGGAPIVIPHLVYWFQFFVATSHNTLCNQEEHMAL